MRPTERIENFFRLLKEEWIKQSPDLRFGQFLFNNGIVDMNQQMYHKEAFEILHDHFPNIEPREYIFWGTRGKDGKQPLKYILLKHLMSDHIEAILETQKQMNKFYKKEFEKELKQRRKIDE